MSITYITSDVRALAGFLRPCFRGLGLSRLVVRSLVFVLSLLICFGGAQAQEDTNSKCPVLSDRDAIADYAVTYKGREVRFCCSECVIEFNKHPEIYESVLPQLRHIPWRTRLALFMGTYGYVVVAAVLLAMLIGLRILNWRRPGESAESATGMARVLQWRISATVPLLVLVGYLSFEVWSVHSQLAEKQLRDEIHFATFHDFGFPPTPRRPETPPRLMASFYRGNDERSPRLFNEGNYRTATFHVSLCDASGQSLQAGDRIVDQDVFVKFEIDRPPFTPDFLYNQEMMDTMFLTAECEFFLGRDQPVADAVSLTETEPMQHWEALFPIRRSTDCNCTDEYRGTIYVCEKYFQPAKFPFLKSRLSGARFHYGIRYDLELQDGVLTDTSDVYMGALYRTRKLPTWRVPMAQWFSHEPIPELPSENVSDPDLLGFPEHVARQQLRTQQ